MGKKNRNRNKNNHNNQQNINNNEIKDAEVVNEDESNLENSENQEFGFKIVSPKDKFKADAEKASKENEKNSDSKEKGDKKDKKGDPALFGGIIFALILIAVAAGYWFKDVHKEKDDLVGDDIVLEDSVDLVLDENGEVNIDEDLLEKVLKEAESLPKMNTKIAVLANSDLSENGESCSDVVYINKEIVKTPAVLNSSLLTLFVSSEEENFVKTQKDLIFNKATIENGVANVYLTGNAGPLENECDFDRVESQIKSTTKQFSTITDVKIFLNNSPFVK